MAIFKEKQNSSNRRPTETIELTKSLVASIWSSEDENGNVRFHWDVSRISDDGSRTFKTMTVESLLEAPAFVAKLSLAFANSSGVPAELREKLALQAEAITECLLLVNGASERKVNGQANGNRVFAA